MARWKHPAGLMVLLLSTFASAEARAATIQFQGRLTSPAGGQVAGTVTITFRLYDAPAGGILLWEETQTLGAESGVVRTLLGSQENPLDASLFSGPDRWLALRLGPDAEASPRLRLASVPWALLAVQAETLEEGVATGWMIADATITFEKLAWQCSDGQVLVMGATGWTCGASPLPP